MTNPTLDDVLQRVAAGELTPDEALTLLEPPATPAGSTTDEPPAPPAPGPAWGTPTASASARPGRSRLVRINASYRSVDVLGDPSVVEISVSGSHAVHSEEGVLTVTNHENPLVSALGGFGLEPGTSFTFADLPRGLARARAWKDQHLVVRVNPELPVEIDAGGANVRVSGLEAGVKARLLASSLKLERTRGPLDLDAFTSSVKGVASPNGTSRISSEASSVQLALGSGTDVQITARARMGKVILPNGLSKTGLADPDVTQARVGAGHGTLTIDSVMSSVTLTSTEDGE